jgi:hypothetical protein
VRTDHGQPTAIQLRSGGTVFLRDDACKKCGCFEAFIFECNCGQVHSDVCYSCGKFVDAAIDPGEVLMLGEVRESIFEQHCGAGRTEHKHEAF